MEGPRRDLSVNVSKIKGSLGTVKDHIMLVLTFGKLPISDLEISTMHCLCLAIIYSLASYGAYLVVHIMGLKIIKLILKVLFPVYPLVFCLVFALYAFIGGNVYGNLLNDYRFANYYIVFLGGAYIPLAVLLSALSHSLIWPLFICAGIASEMFIRDSLMAGRTWENPSDRNYFYVVSILMNVGVYGLILPYIFLD